MNTMSIEQMPQRVGIFHHAAAELDDRDLVAEAANPAEGLDQHVGFFDRVLVVFFDGHRQRGQGSGFRSRRMNGLGSERVKG